MKVLFLETAVGWNTPGIVKFAFWQMTNEWPDATYACLNYSESDLFDPTISRVRQQKRNKEQSAEVRRHG